MGAVWIRGEFEGECQGGLTPPPDLTRPDARWYGLTLRHGLLRDARIVEAPPAGGTKAPFRQAQLDDCVFVSPNGIDDWHRSSVFDVRVHEWDLAHHVEANNHTWAVMRGTLFARVDDGAPEPKVILPPPVVQESDIGPVAVLALLVWLAWLYWTCGPLACCVWAAPVALSHWRWKVTPRAGASALTKGVQAVVGLGLFGLGVGVFAVGAQAARDQCELAVWLPAAFLLVCIAAAAVLVPAWPLRGLWLLWSIFVSIACFRTDAVCTDVSKPKAAVREAAAKLAPLLGLDGEKGRPGSEGKGGNDQGPSSSGGNTSPPDGKGSGGTGNAERGRGSGSGDDDGDAQRKTGRGSADADADDEGRRPGDGKGERPGERMSVDDALSDPSKFFGDRPKPVRLESDLLFDFDSDQLKESAQPRLRQIAELIRQRDERRVVLEGHSDGIGGARHNQDLSERRAQAVRQWLIYQEHLNPGQLEARGLGTSRPVVPLTGSRDAQRPNRRVEVRVSD